MMKFLRFFPALFTVLLANWHPNPCQAATPRNLQIATVSFRALKDAPAQYSLKLVEVTALAAEATTELADGYQITRVILADPDAPAPKVSFIMLGLYGNWTHLKNSRIVAVGRFIDKDSANGGFDSIRGMKARIIGQR